ncbi:hypothetical protein [Sphingobium sp.]|uniref:hypothetical protein n=1 Tax=Sphingobium sp. TaxID=1912891 RepID=UPI002C2EA8B9|nr:hypothetical protein [Sphingobium sp.]HUD94908.1 hypothetical protein [Sphingobium sp.]
MTLIDRRFIGRRYGRLWRRLHSRFEICLLHWIIDRQSNQESMTIIRLAANRLANRQAGLEHSLLPSRLDVEGSSSFGDSKEIGEDQGVFGAVVPWAIAESAGRTRSPATDHDRCITISTISPVRSFLNRFEGRTYLVRLRFALTQTAKLLL